MSLTLTIEMDFSINLLTNLASEKLECPLMKPHLTFEGHVVRRRRRKKASSGKKNYMIANDDAGRHVRHIPIVCALHRSASGRK